MGLFFVAVLLLSLFVCFLFVLLLFNLHSEKKFRSTEI